SLPGDTPKDADLFRTITLGTGTGAAMPAFYWLAPQDRWALVLTVKRFSPSLRGTGLRADGSKPYGPAEEDDRSGPDRLADESLREGRGIWDALGCAGCHGSSGKGMTPREAHARFTDESGENVPRSGD